MEKETAGMEDLNLVMRERQKKAEDMEKEGLALFPNGYAVAHRIKDLVASFAVMSAAELEAHPEVFSVAGRIMAVRSFGKSIFMHLLDAGEKLQIYIQQNQIGKESYGLSKKLDIGDIIRVRGPLFRTRTEELTLLAQEVELLTKNLRPLPEKYHGLKDVEMRYRQRYVDLIVNEAVRDTFRKRAEIIQTVRRFSDGSRVSRGRDPDDAAHSRRGHGQAFQDPSQCPGHGPLSAHRSRNCTSNGCWWAGLSGSSN